MLSKPIECNEPYNIKPVRLEDTTDPGYVQPWSGFVPKCEHNDPKDCDKFTIQKTNIKKEWIYRTIEVHGNVVVRKQVVIQKYDVLRMDRGVGYHPHGAVDDLILLYHHLGTVLY